MTRAITRPASMRRARARYSILIKEERFRFIQREGGWRWKGMNSRRTFAQSNTALVLAENTLVSTRKREPLARFGFA